MKTEFEQAPAFGEATEVAPGVLWCRMPVQGVPDHVNIFALQDDQGWTLVDTGEHTKVSAAALSRLLSGALAGQPVHRLLLTHFHPDHMGQAATLVAQGARCWATRETASQAELAQLGCGAVPNESQLLFAVRGGLRGLALEAFRRHCPSDYTRRVETVPTAYEWLGEGDEVTIGDRTWRVHLGQGHAAGHATYWSDDGLAIMADHALPGMAADLSVHDTNPDADPIQAWFDSCNRFADMADETLLCLPGHNMPYRGMAIRCRQLIAVHERVLGRLHAGLIRPKTALDCLELVYGRRLSPNEGLDRLGEAVGYLNHLHAKGLISRQLDRQGAWVWRQAAQRPTTATTGVSGNSALAAATNPALSLQPTQHLSSIRR